MIVGRLILEASSGFIYIINAWRKLPIFGVSSLRRCQVMTAEPIMSKTGENMEIELLMAVVRNHEKHSWFGQFPSSRMQGCKGHILCASSRVVPSFVEAQLLGWQCEWLRVSIRVRFSRQRQALQSVSQCGSPCALLDAGEPVSRPAPGFRTQNLVVHLTSNPRGP